MFSTSGTSSRLAASTVASVQTKSYDQILAMRISLQKLLEVGNKLPGREMLDQAKAATDDVIEAQHKLASALDSTLYTLTTLLADQAPGTAPSSSSSKQPRSTQSLSWEEVQAPLTALRPKWEATLDKWNARLHFGSEGKQSKLKVFNRRVWEQIAAAMQDERRCVDKSRAPLAESARMDKHWDRCDGAGTSEDELEQTNRGGDGDDDNEDEDGGPGMASRKRSLDTQVYDDRALYALLLKTFIQGASQDSVGMRAEDMAALRKYRRASAAVDRRASKGRKIRFVAHAKLQNFMFPVELPEAPMDVDRLLHSLFQ